MGDKIVVMNHGVVEQFGTPQQIYDHPATLFVADFIGSPAMNFLSFEGSIQRGTSAISLSGHTVQTPEMLEDSAPCTTAWAPPPSMSPMTSWRRCRWGTRLS